MTCPTPLETIVDYFARALAEAEEEALEEHVFECDACARRLEVIGAITHGVATIESLRRNMMLAATSSLIADLDERGVKMRHYRLGPGDIIPCTVSADDDLVVTWYRAELEGVDHVNVTLFDEAGNTMSRFTEFPIDKATGGVIAAISGDVLRTFPALKLRVRLTAMIGSEERTVAEYFHHHTPMSA